MDVNTSKYYMDNSDALTGAVKIQMAKDLLELERQGILEYTDGRWGLAPGVVIEETPDGPIAHLPNHHDHLTKGGRSA